MVGRKREYQRQQEQKQLEAYRAFQNKAKALFNRLHETEEKKGPHMAAEILQLFKFARAETVSLRQSILDKGYVYDHDSEAGSLADGDVATSVAEGIADIARSHKTNPQTMWQALSEQFPDVHFDVDWFDLASLIAATLRQERILGMLEGLELAGVEIPKRD